VLNTKNKSNKSTSRSNPQKKKPLDDLLTKNPQSLVKGYSTKELQELYTKVASMEREIGQFVDHTPQVASVLSVKKDNGSLWFYVQWDSTSKSFVPARVLNKIAPDKVIEYYESVLTFQPDKITEPDKLKEESQPTDMQTDTPQKQDEPKTSSTPSLEPSKNSLNIDQTQHKDEKPFPIRQPHKPQKPNQPLPQSQTIPPAKPSGFVTVNCTGCMILLQYPEGTKSKIKCPACSTIMHPL